MTGLKMKMLTWLTMVSLLLVGFSPSMVLAHGEGVPADLGIPVPGQMADDDEWDDDDVYDDDEWDDDDVYDDDEWDDDDYYDDDEWDDDDYYDDDDDDWDDDLDDDDVVAPVWIDRPVADQAILQLGPGVDADDFADDHDVTIINRVESRNVILVNLNAADNDEEELNELLTDDDVEWAELNYTSRAPEGDPRFFFGNAASEPRLVDGPALPAGLDFAPAEICASGRTVVVAVLDTGIDSDHPSIQNTLHSDGMNMLDPTGDVTDTGDGVDNDLDGYVDEMVGHGTHVAGTVLMVAPDARILPVKVLDSDGVGDTFTVMAGIFYAVENDADVINLSLGTTHDSLAIRQAITFAEEQGVVVVAAAGNDSQANYLQYPASIESVISVAALNESGDRAEYSNFNASVDISAPGDNVASAYPGGLYTTASGTSMASPIVAGTVALILEQSPDSSPAEVMETIRASAAPLNLADPTLHGLLGAGKINVPETLLCHE